MPVTHTMMQEKPARRVGQALWRGLQCRCPHCGGKGLFRAYLKVADHCPTCHEALHHHRADDAPPYFTIVIVGHIVVAGVLWMEKAYHPELWIHAIIWLPLTLILSLLLLPPVKGAVVGLQWANYMHGFDPDERESEDADPVASETLRSEPTARRA